MLMRNVPDTRGGLEASRNTYAMERDPWFGLLFSMIDRIATLCETLWLCFQAFQGLSE